MKGQRLLNILVFIVLMFLKHTRFFFTLLTYFEATLQNIHPIAASDVPSKLTAIPAAQVRSCLIRTKLWPNPGPGDKKKLCFFVCLFVFRLSQKLLKYSIGHKSPLCPMGSEVGVITVISQQKTGLCLRTQPAPNNVNRSYP